MPKRTKSQLRLQILRLSATIEKTPDDKTKNRLSSKMFKLYGLWNRLDTQEMRTYFKKNIQETKKALRLFEKALNKLQKKCNHPFEAQKVVVNIDGTTVHCKDCDKVLNGKEIIKTVLSSSK